MYYEIYIDQFFAEHLLTGFLLLELSAMLLRRHASWKRVLSASAANTVAVTLAVVFCTAGSCQSELGRSIALTAGYLMGLVGAGRIVFGKERNQPWGIIFAVLILMTIAFAGMQEAVETITGMSGSSGIVLSALALGLLVSGYEKKRLKRERTAEVIVYWDEKEQKLSGMIDTGNLLQEPLTGKAVSIVEKESVLALLGTSWQQRRGFFLIPYHSIGKDRGWLQAVTVDKMEIRTAGRRVCVEQPILAIYEGNLSAQKEYQIILHPQHVN